MGTVVVNGVHRRRPPGHIHAGTVHKRRGVDLDHQAVPFAEESMW